MELLIGNYRIAILGAGNIGLSIAKGLLHSGLFEPGKICLTRRRIHLLSSVEKSGILITRDNTEAVRNCDIIIIAVEPQQITGLLKEIKPFLVSERHTIISVVTGVKINQIEEFAGKEIPVVRAMPNIAISVGESMTCLAGRESNGNSLGIAGRLFDLVGRTLIINEEEMIAATAIGACGVAFFLRAIRAASQGGIEIGLQSEHALNIATQAAKGAASLLLSAGSHPEQEIDKVTTPKGCTIAGLNLMEYEGFSSAMIKGITLSAQMANKLYTGDKD
ncbi:MAG: pyrroline-5-carboxylate reductase [Bacteroidales bacterium]